VVPELEPVLAAVWLYPTLCIATASPSAVVVWDALVGRPLRVISARQMCYRGADVTSMVRDRRGRKLLVGDAAGGVHAINLATAAVAKALDPVWVTLRVDKQEMEMGRGRSRGSGRRSGQEGERTASAASSSTAGSGIGSGEELIRSPVVDMHYLASRQEIVYAGTNGRVIVADDLPLEGWTQGQPHSLVLRRFAPPAVDELPPMDHGQQAIAPPGPSATAVALASGLIAAARSAITQGSDAVGDEREREGSLLFPESTRSLGGSSNDSQSASHS